MTLTPEIATAIKQERDRLKGIERTDPEYSIYNANRINFLGSALYWLDACEHAERYYTDPDRPYVERVEPFWAELAESATDTAEMFRYLGLSALYDEPRDYDERNRMEGALEACRRKDPGGFSFDQRPGSTQEQTQ